MIKRLTILVVLILPLVACGPQSPVGEEEEQPPTLSEVEGAAQGLATTQPVKADQPSPGPEATSTQPEARPTEPDEASPEPGREVEEPASGESEASPRLEPTIVDI